MLQELQASKFGSALFTVHGNDLAFPDPRKLVQEFSIRDFDDLCVALEAVVLHDTLFSPEFDPNDALFPMVLHPLCKEVADADVLKFGEVLDQRQLVTSSRRYRQLSELFMTMFKSDAMKSDAMNTTMRNARLLTHVALEELYGVPLVQSQSSLPVYLSIPDVREEAQAVDKMRMSLAKIYAGFASALLELRRMADGENNLLVPPIALEVLTRAKNVDDIGPVLLEMRERFSKVRRRLRDIDEVLQSPDVPPRRKLREQVRMHRSLNLLLTKEERQMAIVYRDPMTVLTTFGKTLSDVIKVEGLVAGPDLSDVSWGKVAGLALSHLESGYLKFRLRPLHATKRRYLDSPASSVGKIAKRLFGYELKSTDVAQAKAEAAALEDKLRELFRPTQSVP